MRPAAALGDLVADRQLARLTLADRLDGLERDQKDGRLIEEQRRMAAAQTPEVTGLGADRFNSGKPVGIGRWPAANRAHRRVLHPPTPVPFPPPSCAGGEMARKLAVRAIGFSSRFAP